MRGIIKTQDLWRTYVVGGQQIHAVKNLSLEILKGQFTIIKGRSGSGKTSLINLLGALDNPTSGKIFFDKVDLTSMSIKERNELRKQQIGYVFQSGALLSNMTAFENVDLALRIVGFDKNERKKRVAECLELVGLKKRMAHFPYELSGGEVQRVAIARAIAHRPKIIFADEPTAALDTNRGLQIVKIFKDMVQKEGISVVMTTHDPNMMEIANCVYTLQDGELVNE
ncbi:MAG: ABC transporter ATP-binding protein [Clostridium sp.]|uniref:ABC transporter ATP-binding protein n=1 Tax=Clostridium sp. TaxID=1506 RepID=UPI003D6CB507